MEDDNWERAYGKEAHEIEALNYASQINVVKALFKQHTQQYGLGEEGCSQPIGLKELFELHRTGTLFLLEEPGQYRRESVNVRYASGTIVYSPPEHHLVPAMMEDFAETLAALWSKMHALEIAAYALWRINSIHPFLNGNGRSARAFAYACLCLKKGTILPGSPTVLDLLMSEEFRPKYYAALRYVDRSAQRGDPELNLAPMAELLDDLLAMQLENAKKARTARGA